jgi:hypothetical protein
VVVLLLMMLMVLVCVVRTAQPGTLPYHRAQTSKLQEKRRVGPTRRCQLRRYGRLAEERGQGSVAVTTSVNVRAEVVDDIVQPRHPVLGAGRLKGAYIIPRSY